MTELYLRKAQKMDADILYEWANEAECRKNSFSLEPIAYEEHIQWLKRVMENEAVQLYICMSDEIPIGQIRLDISGKQAVISYSVDHKQRGKGFGTTLLQLAEHKIKETSPKVTVMTGEVKKDNPSSQKRFEKNGYERKIKEDCYEYVKTI